MSQADAQPKADIAHSGEAQASEHAAALSALLSMRIVHLFLALRRSTLTGLPSNPELTRLEWRIMTQLDGSRPLSLTTLAARLMLDRGQLSRAVKGMVARGLLTRSRKPGGPEIEIDLSPGGFDIRAAMVDRAAERDRFLMEGVHAEDQKVAFRVIEHMIARAELGIDDIDGDGG